MRAFAAGKVVTSKSAKFSNGDYVVGYFGVQEYAVSAEDEAIKVDITVAPLSTFLSALGRTGLTAYFGLLELGLPKKGETVVISAAAGAVGSVVGQIAKILGCRTIGITGGEIKCAYLVDKLKFDAAIDYKREDIDASLKKHCPKGIDIYFDNVGGDILNTALAHLAFGGRVLICGAISQYNKMESIQGPSNYLSLLFNHGSMQGFTVYDYEDRFHEGIQEMAGWLKQGKLISTEEVIEGLENFPQTFFKLFNGDKIGKLILQIHSNKLQN